MRIKLLSMDTEWSGVVDHSVGNSLASISHRQCHYTSQEKWNYCIFMMSNFVAFSRSYIKNIGAFWGHVVRDYIWKWSYFWIWCRRIEIGKVEESEVYSFFFYFTVNCSVQVSTKTWFPLPKYLSKEVRDFVTSWFKHTAAAATTTTTDTAVSTSITAVITTTSG